MEGKWIWVVLLIAYYLYSAYAANKKKQEEANRKQPQTGEPPKKHFNPTPTYQPLPKPMGDIFKEIFGEEILPKPTVKPVVKEQPKKLREKEKIKIPVTTFIEGERSIQPGQVAPAMQQTEITVPQPEAYSLNAREAFIGSVIFNRPEY